MIRVLITDDSRATQRILTTMLKGQRGIEVVGAASNGREAVEKYRELHPDLVTMDIFMPEMDGLEATREIMSEFPDARIVIISSMVNSKDLKTSFEAMRSGAIEVIGKPRGVLSGDYSEVKRSLIAVLKRLMSASPENRFSWDGAPEFIAGGGLEETSDKDTANGKDEQQVAEEPAVTEEVDLGTPSEMEGGVLTLQPAPDYPALQRERIPENFYPAAVCFGGSTGAPAVLVDILSRLPADFPVPIVIAQHIARGFAGGLADWLDSSCQLRARLANGGDVLKPGQIFISRDDHHLRVRLRGILDMIPSMRTEQYTPSVNLFFESVAEAFGPRGLGIILTGMGSDGAQGLLRMRQVGAVTIAQNERTSVVYGMPKIAMDAGAVIKEMSPSQIVHFLTKISRQINGQN